MTIPIPYKSMHIKINTHYHYIKQTKIFQKAKHTLDVITASQSVAQETITCIIQLILREYPLGKISQLLQKLESN